MKPRNKILSQSLIIGEQYEINIIVIVFLTIDTSTEEVFVIYEDNNSKHEFRYTYNINNTHEIDSFIGYFSRILQKNLMEEK